MQEWLAVTSMLFPCVL